MVFFAFQLLNDIAYILYRFLFLKTQGKNTQLPYMVIACFFFLKLSSPIVDKNSPETLTKPLLTANIRKLNKK